MYQAEPEKKQTAERKRYQADPEKIQTAERERYKADPEKKRSAKGNVIWRVLNVLAWRRECGTGRLSVVPCETNEAIEKVLLRAIDGFARSNDRAAPSMDPLIAHLSIDHAIIDRSRSHLSIARYCACAIDGGNMLHVLWCETVLQLLRHY